MNTITPLRQQYLDIKAQYPNDILFFRLGDFYELFDADAELGARELDLILTSRPISKTERVPMAGVPYHAIEQYVTLLVSKGYSVALCDQITEPSGRGLVERDVTRVISPTLPEVDPETLAREWGTDIQLGMFGTHRPMPLKQLRLF